MSPRQRLLIIRLSEKIEKDPAYAKTVGLEIINNATKRQNSADGSPD